MLKERTEKILGTFISCLAICVSVIGLFYSDGGASFQVNNIYGQPVVLYGKGIYANNSLMTVAGRLGADWMGLISGLLMMTWIIIGKKKMWAYVLRLAQCFSFIYYFACLVFSISMNRFYLIYVLGFGLSIFTSIILWVRYAATIEVKDSAKENKNIGISLCLAVSGIITILIWIVMLLPNIIANDFGDLLGVLTTEATYAIDLGVLCPGMILCAVMVNKKMNSGYKIAPIFLYILLCVGPMVILQNVYSGKLGIEVPIPAFVGTVLSFIAMCLFALLYLYKSIRLLRWSSDYTQK
ncbi:MAG: hypothetical protein MJ133_06825 [Lachnospiraceae bacterium]|nr:hypothetical protein [Lachnospiraceae bacterium]